ncbi:MAG TPA: acetone carboxylase subunit gamma [Gammaproteobacteria bacterium]|nr:acetone carboxylase subunit gamma [Gammaproteobacteria bacterium]
MKICITEYLRIDLDRERWECRRCGRDLGAAREDYKRGLLVHDRDPREIHRPLIDPAKYGYTFAPDPAYTALLEYYCPGCGTLVETEYTVPGHPPVRDIELDIDSLKEKARAWAAEHGGALPEPESLQRPAHARHSHSHS